MSDMVDTTFCYGKGIDCLQTSSGIYIVGRMQEYRKSIFTLSIL